MSTGCNCPLGDNPPRLRQSSVNCDIAWWVNPQGRLVIKHIIWVPHMMNTYVEWARLNLEEINKCEGINVLGCILRNRHEVKHLRRVIAYIRKSFTADNVDFYQDASKRREVYAHIHRMVQAMPEMDDSVMIDANEP